MGDEAKAEALGKGGHLRRRDHRFAAAGGDDHVGVVDHAIASSTAEVAERGAEEGLALEAK